MLRLFDTMQRTFGGPRSHSEPSFDYLNRSARRSAATIRDIVEGWFAELPTSDNKEVRSRFRSSDDQQHLGAFFEIYCSALLRSHGYSLESHPQADSDVRTTPDFLVAAEGAPLFYLEATSASESREQRKEEARLNQVYDALNQIDSPSFFLWSSVRKAPSTSPPTSKVIPELEVWLASLDPDVVQESIDNQGLDGFPEYVWDHGDWEILFRAFPKKPNARGNTSRPVGALSTPAEWRNDRASLLNSFKKKAGRYGDLDMPYIVALNALSPFADMTDVMDALFGTECYVMNVGNDKTLTPQRKPDGLWMSPAGPSNTRVSAALICFSVVPWTVGSATHILIHNPWAQHPLDPASWRGPQLNQSGHQEGESGADLLGLSDPDPYDLDR